MGFEFCRLIAKALEGDVEFYKENKKVFHKFWFIAFLPDRNHQVRVIANHLILDRVRLRLIR